MDRVNWDIANKKYDTKLSPKDEQMFINWAIKNGKVNDAGLPDTYDYDLRGAWKAITSGKMNGQDERGHLGDLYKKPNHPTFSNQSMYNGVDGLNGGQWIEHNGKTYFTPSSWNVDNIGGLANMQNYINKAERGAAELSSPTMMDAIKRIQAYGAK